MTSALAGHDGDVEGTVVLLKTARQGVPTVTPVTALAMGIAAIGALTGMYSAWLHLTNPTTIALSLLLVVLVVATVSTRWVAITISVVAFLAFNYFFLPPLRTWTVADPQNWVALFSLLAVSVVASHLSSQVRRRAQDATARRDEVARLFDLTCDILLTTDTADAVADIARHIARRFALERVTICLPQAQGWKLCASDAGNPDVHTAWLESALARRPARASAEPQGQRYSGHQRLDLANGRHAWLVPLRTVTRPIGFLALEDEDIDPGTRDAIAGVAAIAIERTHLLEDRKEAEVVRRGSELKSALLASLGHDLKTPLTAASVAANNLDASWLTDAQRREQIEIVRTELGRLNRLFQDILDMARIDTHAVAAEVEWVQPEEIVEAAAAQVQHSLETHRLEIAVDSNRIFVRVDPRLTSAALAHVLENAAQYSPPGSSIVVTAGLSSGELHLSVRDHGAGIAPGDVDHLFERFYRGGEARRRRFGTGMGLAITRGLLAAEGGRISAANHPDGGAVFTIAVPTESRTADAVEVEAL